MAALILVLVISGIFAGLIQFFADYKGLPLYQPQASRGEGFNSEPQKGAVQKFYDFVRKHWQFFGYMVIGIAGAFLVPVIGQFIELKGIQNYLNCIDTDTETICSTPDWFLLVILGYGIILGYSSVRLIRSLGSFLLGGVTKKQVEQQQMLEEAQKQIKELKVKLEALEPRGQNLISNTLPFSLSLEALASNSLDDEDARAELDATASFVGCNENPNPTPWRDWRAAASLKTLLNQINALAASRNKASDGMIGDSAHQDRNSDHNPWVWDEGLQKGVVTALDITHDPAGKCDCEVLAKSLEANMDSRIKYVIWNKQIMNSSSINGSAAWAWRSYSGKNPHSKHIHISVKCDRESYDNTDTWMVKVN
ncbi:MAG TPA: hypothetical protein PK076_12080 [Saprospiraceae bacterium]|nr:hypothetical protein [Saprospiraceae bacterium]